MITPGEFYYEWGWVSRFDNGNDYDQDICLSEADAFRDAIEYNAGEIEAVGRGDYPISERLFYTVRKRLVMTPGAWEDV